MLPQPNRKSATEHDRTYEIPKVLKTKLHTQENPIPCDCPNKERDTLGCLNLPIPFYGKTTEEEPCNL